jgi:hypothetical protein
VQSVSSDRQFGGSGGRRYGVDPRLELLDHYATAGSVGMRRRSGSAVEILNRK